LEDFAACKDQNELCVTNVFFKAMLSAVAPITLKKLSLIELRKLFGYTSASERDGMRQLVEVPVGKVLGFATCFPLSAYQVCSYQHMSRGIVLPVGHQIIEFP
jgi:hypothetical protein